MNNAILILAGGLGKRMKSPLPKVLHKLNNFSLLGNIINKISINLNNDIFVVTGKYHNIIQNQLKDELGELENKITYVNQSESLGTGHALQCAFESIKNYDGVIVLNGDVPFINIDTIKEINNNKANCLLGICKMDILKPEWKGHGRIILKDGNIIKIVEEKDCSEEQKLISTINGGLYYFNNYILSKFINNLNNNNKQNEYYITDYIDIFVTNGYNVQPVYLSVNEVLNVNTPEQLQTAKKILNL